MVRPWDTPGLPPRTEAERCTGHGGFCAYRDDDPAYCPYCHRSWWRIEVHPLPPTKPETRAEHLAKHARDDARRRASKARSSDRRARAGTQVGPR